MKFRFDICNPKITSLILVHWTAAPTLTQVVFYVARAECKTSYLQYSCLWQNILNTDYKVFLKCCVNIYFVTWWSIAGKSVHYLLTNFTRTNKNIGGKKVWKMHRAESYFCSSWNVIDNRKKVLPFCTWWLIVLWLRMVMRRRALSMVDGLL